MLYCTNIGEELASKITLPILEKNYHLKLLTQLVSLTQFTYIRHANLD